MTVAATICGTVMVLGLLCVPAVWAALADKLLAAAVRCSALSISLPRAPRLYRASRVRARRQTAKALG